MNTMKLVIMSDDGSRSRGQSSKAMIVPMAVQRRASLKEVSVAKQYVECTRIARSVCCLIRIDRSCF